jgi:LytS/YehU family sensor histidine kinase
LVKEAELKSLKYQINPHFIFNSLNSISSLTLSNPQKAQEMTIKLSSFLRSTLSKNERQKSKLSEEINNAKLYLDIEKVRFDDKFNFIEELEPKCMELEVPSMILQPLFENAIKHGVYESLDKVTIKLKCGHEKDYFKIIVENTFDPESVPRKGEGIGIKNIQNRLKLIYNQDNLVTTEKINNLFRVNIFIPV